jgi:diguanylate cyclase (GGDEF)-like protein
MQKPILQNLVEMTGHRDHLRLEISVLSTLQKLTGVVSVRALELFTHSGRDYLRPRSWLENEQIASSATEAALDPHRERLSQYPQLQAGLAAEMTSVLHSPRKGCYVLWLPVWMQNKVTTCLEVTQSRPFSAHKRDVIFGIFQVYQNYQSLLDYSERDALTDLFNRKTFDEQFARHARTGIDSCATDLADTEAGDADMRQQQWLAVVDIDHFKQVNDRFGHLYGDEVLILVANILRASFRSQDRIFRFGGEEFVVLLRSATLSTAQMVFNRFRETVQAHHFPQVGSVTVSIGFAGTHNGSSVEILGQADQALYFAKENGRNRVCYYDELMEQGQLRAKFTSDDVELF